MRDIRTDLVYESVHGMDKSIDGVISEDAQFMGVRLNRIEIKTKEASLKLEREIGRYTTVFCPSLTEADGDIFLSLISCIANELSLLLDGRDKNVLIVGLGNTCVTPDALGPMSVRNIIVSRHIKRGMNTLYQSLNLGEMAAIAPGVLGQTGVESAEIIKAVADKISPDALIVIDSLMSGKAERLARTVQLTDTGIVPGSGINNNRFEISPKTMGVPVVTIGIPMVIDAGTLAKDIVGSLIKEGQDGDGIIEKNLPSSQGSLVVTPKHIDAIVNKAARLIGFSINKAIHKKLTVEDMTSLLA